MCRYRFTNTFPNASFLSFHLFIKKLGLDLSRRSFSLDCGTSVQFHLWAKAFCFFSHIELLTPPCTYHTRELKIARIHSSPLSFFHLPPTSHHLSQHILLFLSASHSIPSNTIITTTTTPNHSAPSTWSHRVYTVIVAFSDITSCVTLVLMPWRTSCHAPYIKNSEDTGVICLNSLVPGVWHWIRHGGGVHVGPKCSTLDTFFSFK